MPGTDTEPRPWKIIEESGPAICIRQVKGSTNLYPSERSGFGLGSQISFFGGIYIGNNMTPQSRYTIWYPLKQKV